jgi:hypothetical protein
MTTERTTDTKTSYADRVLREVQISAACGLDPDQAREVAGSLLVGLAKMAKALEDATYAPGEYEKIARSAAHAMKSADGLVRLMEFALGPARLAGGRGDGLAPRAHERADRDRLGMDRGGWNVSVEAALAREAAKSGRGGSDRTSGTSCPTARWPRRKSWPGHL